MPRIQGVRRDDLDSADRALFDELAGHRVLVDGAVAGPFGVLLHSPEAARLTSRLGRYFRFDSGLDQRLRHLVALVVAGELDCQYEFTVHARLGREEGLDKRVVEALARREAPSGLSGPEDVIVRATRALIRTHHIDDASMQELVAHLGMRQATDLIANAGFLAMLATVMNAFEVEVQPGHAPELPPRVPRSD